MDDAQLCAQLIEESNNIAGLTGAGISTAAGIPDFRGPNGLYVTKEYDPDTVFDINYFLKDPQPFFDFARDFINLEQTLNPTYTHQFLASLEEKQKLKGIVTQNIDSLHQRAGSRNVLEMHGSFWQSTCLDCYKKYSYDQIRDKLSSEDVCHCECSGVIKPDIVFFGENVNHLQESQQLAQDADLFFIIGTSCVVYPAATVPQYTNGRVVVVNLDPISISLPNISLTISRPIDEFFLEVKSYL